LVFGWLSNNDGIVPVMLIVMFIVPGSMLRSDDPLFGRG
jgi:hypothetical protein